MKQSLFFPAVVSLLLLSLSVATQEEQDSSKTVIAASSDQGGNEENIEEEQTSIVYKSLVPAFVEESDSKENQEITGSSSDNPSPSSVTPENKFIEIPVITNRPDSHEDTTSSANIDSHVDMTVTKNHELGGGKEAQKPSNGSTDSETRPYATNPSTANDVNEAHYGGNSTRVESESSLRDEDVNKLKGPTTSASVSADFAPLYTEAASSPSIHPSLALADHSISSLEVPEINSYGDSKGRGSDESKSPVPTAEDSLETIANPQSETSIGAATTATSQTGSVENTFQQENLPESSTSFFHPPVSDVASKPTRKSRSEIPETHHRDIVYLVVKYKDFDVFNWVDSKDQSLRYFIASKLQELRNHSFADKDVLYIDNSPRVKLDTLLIEMGVVDHEFRHGLHLYPGDRVVDVVGSQNVTDEMCETLSVNLLTITSDKTEAKRVFHQSQQEPDEPLISSIIVRGDMVLFILILTLISSSVVIFVFICYCCRRKGKNLFGNHNSPSAVQLPTGTTSPQEFDLRTLERLPPLYTCYDLNPAAEILRDEKFLGDRGSNLSINFPVNGNSVTLLKNHYPQAQMNRRSSSHTGLHKIHVNEAWIQVLPPNSLENVNAARKYSKSSSCSSSSSNPELKEGSCNCNEEPSFNVRIRHQSSLKNAAEATNQKERNSSQMVSFITLNGMKDTKL